MSRRAGPFPRALDVKGGALDMSHGAGGRASAQLFHDLILPALDNPALAAQEDQGRIGAGAERPAFSTDAYVVTPLTFPGGDIGKLAVHGTINDLAMAGAAPIALSLAVIAAEGTPLALLRARRARFGWRGRADSGRARGDRRHQGGRTRPRRPAVPCHERHRARR